MARTRRAHSCRDDWISCEISARTAWIDPDATKIGYEISFTRHFYQPQPLRTLEEIRADILAVQKGAEGLLDELIQGASK